jgi:hypothetical protein
MPIKAVTVPTILNGQNGEFSADSNLEVLCLRQQPLPGAQRKLHGFSGLPVARYPR